MFKTFTCVATFERAILTALSSPRKLYFASDANRKVLLFATTNRAVCHTFRSVDEELLAPKARPMPRLPSFMTSEYGAMPACASSRAVLRGVIFRPKTNLAQRASSSKVDSAFYSDSRHNYLPSRIKALYSYIEFPPKISAFYHLERRPIEGLSRRSLHGYPVVHHG
jgi:hypothetical protein